MYARLYSIKQIKPSFILSLPIFLNYISQQEVIICKSGEMVIQHIHFCIGPIRMVVTGRLCMIGLARQYANSSRNRIMKHYDNMEDGPIRELYLWPLLMFYWSSTHIGISETSESENDIQLFSSQPENKVRCKISLQLIRPVCNFMSNNIL